MLENRWRSGGWLLLFLLSVLACTLTTPVTPTPRPILAVPTEPVATAAPLAGTALPLERSADRNFAAFLAIPEEIGSPSSYTIPDLSGLSEESVLASLSPGQQRLLEKQGFVVAPARFFSLLDVYRELQEQGVPLYLTTDLLLHSVDIVADVAQQRAGLLLAEDLQLLSEALSATVLAQWQAMSSEEEESSPEMVQAARHNLGFLVVGGRLLNPEFPVPAPVADLVADELTLLEQPGVYMSPLTGRRQDYTLFQAEAAPDGLADYYRALAWYSAPFPLDSSDPAAARQAVRQALLLALALGEGENQALFARLYEPLLYFYGTDASYSLPDVTAAASALYPSWPEVSPTELEAKVDDMVATLLSLSAPGSWPAATAPSIRFLPDRHLPDRILLDALVYNRVGVFQAAAGSLPPTAVETAVGPVRSVPRVLDVAAVLGSDVALAHLEADGETAYEGYEVQLAGLRSRLETLEPSAWTATWPSGWLFSLQPLLAPSATTVEARGWQAREFNSWYGAWVLAHAETRLAPRPVEPDLAPAGQAAYLEQQPALYGHLAALVSQLYRGLEARDLLDTEVGPKLLRLEKLLVALQELSQKETLGETLSNEELLLLRQVPLRLADLTTFEAGPGAVRQTGQRLAQIVSVYETGVGGRTSQAALGDAWIVYRLLADEEETVLAAGAVYSTYELLEGPAERESWVEQLIAQPAPGGWLLEVIAP